MGDTTGLEQYKWGHEKTNPIQELVLPFIRMVAGPLDFTPGAMNNANKENWRWSTPRELKLDLSFLPEGDYTLESWGDGVNADRNGQGFEYGAKKVSPSDKLTLKLAPGGGWVGRLRAASANESAASK